MIGWEQHMVNGNPGIATMARFERCVSEESSMPVSSKAELSCTVA